MSGNPLPSFVKPPVVETVLGVEFAPLEAWEIPQFGLFWQSIRNEFPRSEIQPPLPSHIESFDQVQRKQVQIELLNKPEARCWYISADDRELIQIQRERFLFNWRKGDSKAEYPGYKNRIRPAFEKNWDRFLSFLDNEGIGNPNVVQCEVTYVNHIPRGDGWNEVSDWDQVFTILSETRKPQFLPNPESARFNYNYLMPNRKGRLRVTASRAIRESDGEEVIVLNLSARGMAESSEKKDILHWLDLGREWIVRGFTDITTGLMHQLWKRET